MARKPTAKVPAKRRSTEVGDWRSELAASAKAQVASEDTAASAGGRFFSLRAGQLTFDDAALPGNQMACVILDSLMENVYYKDTFDPDQKTPPTCFAFGRDADTMEIHEEVFKNPETFEPQEPDTHKCADCWANEWGSAEKGKGKACSNRRRLAIIPAGTYKPLGKGGGFDLDIFDEPAPFRDADIAYMKIPVTSVKGFATYLKQVAEQFDRPLWGVVTRVYIEPHPKYQFQVKFELLDVIEDEDIMPVLLNRHKQAVDEIDFPYLPQADDEEQEQRSAASNKKLSKKGGAASGSRARRR